MRWLLLFFLLFFAGCSCHRHDDVHADGKPAPLPSLIKQDPSNFEKTHKSLRSTGAATKAGSVKSEKRRRRQLARAKQTSVQGVWMPEKRDTDTTALQKINYLRSNGISLDLNEPINRQFLNSPVPTRRFPSMIQLSRESFLKVSFDNDILDYTDRFYTNGLRVDLILPLFQANPLGKIMLPYWGAATNYYGITLCQNMYTPSTTKTGGILYGDRPYAAYLYLGSFKISNDTLRQIRQTSEIWVGIIGPSSYGEWVQRSFHNSVPTNNEPLGWEYQIQNDLVLNYNLSLEKGIFSRRNSDLSVTASGSIGTLYTNIGGGFRFRAGWLNPWFINLGVARKDRLKASGLRRSQMYFFIKGSGKVVGYDATLQGGVFNRSSVYTLPAGEITRLVFQTSAGLTFSYGGIRLDLEQFMLSPEFHEGWWHKWIHIGVTFSL